jgi:predicted PurR-regulated permease PerM
MMKRRDSATLFLAGVTAVALYLCYLLIRPYATPILFASVIAIIFYPLHRRTQQMVRRRNLSAGISTAATLILTVVPLTFLLVAISHELSDLYQSLVTKSADSGGVFAYLLHGAEKIVSWASRRMGVPSVDLHDILARRLENASAQLVGLGASLVRNAFSFVAKSVIALVILFFLYRDGEKSLAAIMAALPLPEDRMSELRTRVTSTVVANFYGGVAVGALQGTLTGLTFWALGIDSPVLWGVVTGFLSLVPLVGSGLVWGPAAIVLALTGHLVKAAILAGVGIAVIGTVDNIVRPLIIHRSVRLHTVFVLFALLGGVQLFGVLGLFVGPVILSVTAALVMMLYEDLAGKKQLVAVAKSPEAPAKTQSAAKDEKLPA